VARRRRTIPAALLLPGLHGSARLFAPLLAAGPRGLEVEALSYPPDRPLGYDELLALVRERLPRGRFALVAESFSGPLAIRLAAERPPGLAALVLAASFLHRPLNALLHPLRALAGVRLFGAPMPAAAVRHFLAGAGAPRALVSEVLAALGEVSAAVMAHRAAEAFRVDVREELGRVEVPILWLAPLRDHLVRTDAAAEALALDPDLEVAYIDGPHMILQRCPHACLARIEELLSAPPPPGRRPERTPG
jgi:pimeloyl-ACP methyl ester carboxylesterase